MKLTRVDYDELDRMRVQFEEESEVVAELMFKTRLLLDKLRDRWVGFGADAFLEEFDEELIPALERTRQALTLAADTIREIARRLDSAEYETSLYFREGELE